MDYRFNPVSAQTILKCAPISAPSFKGSYAAAVVTPSNDIFIKSDNNDIVSDYDGSQSGFFKALRNAWRNILEVMPLLDPAAAIGTLFYKTNIPNENKLDN